MVEIATPLFLNIGSGFTRMPGYLGVDLYGEPDIVWDLDIHPYPWADNSVDGIRMFHVLEHLENWWESFTECARVLKPGGTLEIRVPDESSMSALTYRDHRRAFSLLSFHGVQGATHGTNAWAAEVRDSVPLKLAAYYRVPHKQYEWMVTWCPWLLAFCGNHLRNFIHEQRFTFIKVV